MSSEDYIFLDLDKMAVDPFQRYLFFINKPRQTKSELVIFDLLKREITKKILLQTNVNDPGAMYERVIPEIIPIPERNKVFLWGHPHAWCVDLDTMELIYGEVIDNPTSLIYATQKFYSNMDDNRNMVVVVDPAFEAEDVDKRKYVSEIDFDTGEVVRRIGQQPFYQDQEKYSLQRTF